MKTIQINKIRLLGKNTQISVSIPNGMTGTELMQWKKENKSNLLSVFKKCKLFPFIVDYELPEKITLANDVPKLINIHNSQLNFK